jgi:MarR family transcriptional regulator, organic hydroperoxide resistance regulator
MEAKGLIIRKPNPEDGRGVIIHLTEFGRNMRDFSKEIVLGFDQKVRQAITQEELETFNKVAQTIMDLAQSNQPFINK